jgi:hypothetical protein
VTESFPHPHLEFRVLVGRVDVDEPSGPVEWHMRIVESERPPRPGTLVFGVNVTSVDGRLIRDVAVSPQSQNPAVAELVIDLETQRLRQQFRFTLKAGAADRFARAIEAFPRSPRPSR